MGTTVVASLFHNRILSLGFIGDAGYYRLRGSKSMTNKKDHSHFQGLIGRGFFTPEEVRTLQNRNFDSRAPENHPTLALDIF
jgi:serine/threonine protein phosphatase PrpC